MAELFRRETRSFCANVELFAESSSGAGIDTPMKLSACQSHVSGRTAWHQRWDGTDDQFLLSIRNRINTGVSINPGVFRTYFVSLGSYRSRLFGAGGDEPRVVVW